MEKIEKGKIITLILKRIASFIKKDGKLEEVKQPDGSIGCKQDDNYGLIQILEKFDSHIHPVNEWKIKLLIQDKLWEIFKKRSETKISDLEIELTLDEAAFLKSYLVNFPEKEAKGLNLQDFEMRTAVSMLEQLQ